ncbi:MAG: FtsB family cell division protein [Desulfobulbus sp.]|jgi:cell division protein FtsB
MDATRKQRDRQREKKLLWTAGVVLAVLVTAWVLFAPNRGLMEYRALRQEIAALKEENSRLARENERIGQDVKRLRSDDAYLEEVARKTHGLLKKDEMVFDFDRGRKEEKK